MNKRLAYRVVRNWFNSVTHRQLLSDRLRQHTIEKIFGFSLFLVQQPRPLIHDVLQVVRVLFHHLHYLIHDVLRLAAAHLFQARSDGGKVGATFGILMPAILDAADDVVGDIVQVEKALDVGTKCRLIFGRSLTH